MLQGDHNINYLNALERSRLETVILPYDLNINNQNTTIEPKHSFSLKPGQQNQKLY